MRTLVLQAGMTTQTHPTPIATLLDRFFGERPTLDTLREKRAKLAVDLERELTRLAELEQARDDAAVEATVSNVARRNIHLGRARNAVDTQQAKVTGLEQTIAAADTRIAELEAQENADALAGREARRAELIRERAAALADVQSAVEALGAAVAHVDSLTDEIAAMTMNATLLDSPANHVGLREDVRLALFRAGVIRPAPTPFHQDRPTLVESQTAAATYFEQRPVK